MSEAELMKFVRANTSIPVPEVHNAYRDEKTGHIVVVIDFVEEQTLEESWDNYTEEEQQHVISQLRDYMTQLRQFKGTFIGCIDGTACHDQYFYDLPEASGPFKTEDEFNQGIVAVMKNITSGSFVDWRCDVWRSVMRHHEIVLTYGDLDPRNIIVQGSKIAAILVCEFGDYYPEYWEYSKTLSRPAWMSSWMTSRAIDRILEPYHKDVSVVWNLMNITS